MVGELGQHRLEVGDRYSDVSGHRLPPLGGVVAELPSLTAGCGDPTPLGE